MWCPWRRGAAEPRGLIVRIVNTERMSRLAGRAPFMPDFFLLRGVDASSTLIPVRLWGGTRQPGSCAVRVPRSPRGVRPMDVSGSLAVDEPWLRRWGQDDLRVRRDADLPGETNGGRYRERP